MEVWYDFKLSICRGEADLEDATLLNMGGAQQHALGQTPTQNIATDVNVSLPQPALRFLVGKKCLKVV